MILSLSCTAPDATVLGFLLHKHPDRWFEKALSFGTAHVFYPEASPERTTACLSVTIDPVAMVRSGTKSAPATLAQYVSDRPYSPGSFLSVAIGEVFGTALSGNCATLPDAPNTPLPLSATVPALSCDGGESAIRKVFEPLGYTVRVNTDAALLDDRFPEWGAANRFTVTVAGLVTVRDLLAHLTVLIPVLDNAKHYFVDAGEVEKLLRRGENWLATHPHKAYITARYLRYRRTLTDAALSRLAEVAEDSDLNHDDTEDTETGGDLLPNGSELLAPVSVSSVSSWFKSEPTPAKARLNDERIAAALDAIRTTPGGANRVVDLGCGEGKTMARVREAFPNLAMLGGMDVAPVVLQRAARRLHTDRLEGDTRDRVSLFQGSLVYADDRLKGFDVALLMEVLEHINLERLSDVERNVFGFIRPRRLIITTPNAEYNTVWESLPGGDFRHADHRFEWTRAQFEAWGKRVVASYGYSVVFSGIGTEDQEGRGTPTQMAVFDLCSESVDG